MDMDDFSNYLTEIVSDQESRTEIITAVMSDLFNDTTIDAINACAKEWEALIDTKIAGTSVEMLSPAKKSEVLDAVIQLINGIYEKVDDSV